MMSVKEAGVAILMELGDVHDLRPNVVDPQHCFLMRAGGGHESLVASHLRTPRSCQSPNYRPPTSKTVPVVLRNMM